MALLAERPVYKMQHDPRLAGFRRWFAGDGRRSYLLFLAARPDISIGEPLSDVGRLYSPEPSQLEVYRSPDVPRFLPRRLDRVVYAQDPLLLAALALLAVLGGAALAVRRRLRAVAVVPAAMLLSTLPVALIVWNGDAVELDRHLLVGAALTRLTVLVLGTLVLAEVAVPQAARVSRIRALTRLPS
jgi:hypothetical protein